MLDRLQHKLSQAAIRLLIGKENQQLFHQLDWPMACRQFITEDLNYPDYYHKDFHGIKDGYLSPVAPVTYDAITAFASAPNENWLRQQLIGQIYGHPKQILDLGCGTGSSTLLLKQAFLDADVIGLDLSAHMLVMANRKAHSENLEIIWQQGLAEATTFPEASFDLVTASMLFHEMPSEISQAVIKEAYRLSRPAGQFLVLDGNQRRLRKTPWLIQLFREPYSQQYATGSVETWMQQVGFRTSPTHYLGWIHQINHGQK